MAKYTVDWSDEASDTFKYLFRQLVEQFSLEIALQFRVNTDDLLNKLSDNNKLCPKSKKKGLRKCVIHKNTSLIYQLKGRVISLVTFIDNRSNHKF